MSLLDFRQKTDYPAHKYYTKAGQTAVKPGELVVVDTAGDEEYVTLPSNGDGSNKTWVGLCVSNDTVGASADGVVYVVDDPQAEFYGRVTTPANLAGTLRNTTVTLDVVSERQTLDEDDEVNGSFKIRDVDTDNDFVVFSIVRNTL